MYEEAMVAPYLCVCYVVRVDEETQKWKERLSWLWAEDVGSNPSSLG